MISSSIWRGTLTIGLTVLASCGETPMESESKFPTTLPPQGLAIVSNTWITRANIPLTRNLPAVGAVANAAGQWIVYAIGGLAPTGVATRTVQAYNVATNTWSQKAPIPLTAYATNGVGVIDGKLYIAGGITPPSTGRKLLYVYNPATDTWSQKRSMPRAGTHGVSGVINGRLYILTTCKSCDPLGPLAFYRYDPGTDTWTILAIPASDHYAGEGGVIGGKFYVAGGDRIRQLHVYDPATNAWTTRASMPQDQYFGAGAVLGGKLYVIGGVAHDANGDLQLVSTTSVYDPTSNAWSTRAPIPDARANIAGTRVFRDGQSRIELMGGSRPGSNLQYIP